ncbi:hypothetical protein M426DRAFT_322746 [Hypoxylon sp. CI-4A]|nr:hypothetical protein M426DRAFT_322746 [Hypoxylon sp. CI-4A]
MSKEWMMDGDDVYWGSGMMPVMIDPAEWDEWEPGPDMQHEVHRSTTGWLLPPIASSIWLAINTKRSDNLLFDIVCRTKAVYSHLQTLWNDFCLWSEERQKKAQQKPWGVWSCQCGFEDPSPKPQWRMKWILEVDEWKGMNTAFFIGRTDCKWVWKSSQKHRRGSIVWYKQPDVKPDKVPVVSEPSW